MGMKIAPSLLAANFSNLQADMEMINRSEADWLHLDIMDGVFVPNISFGFPVLKHVARLCRKPLDNIKLTNIYQDRQPLRHNILFNQKMRKASQNSRICGKMTATEQEKQSFLTLCRHLLQFFKHNLCLGFEYEIV